MFRLNARHLFLTYPKCTLTKEHALDLIKAKEKLKINEYIVASEAHEDGTPHIHIYLGLEKKVNLTSATYLDLGEFHGNYQAARKSSCVKKYVEKGKDFISNIPESTEVSCYQAARTLATEGKLEEAMSTLSATKQGSRDLTLHGTTIRRELSSLISQTRTLKWTLETFEWTVTWDRLLTLLLWGPTNTGKTALAKALLPLAIMTRHIDKLKGYSPLRNTGVILDEGSFRHLHREAQICVIDVEEDTQIHVRYGIAELPAGTPRIITTNRRPEDILNIEDDAIRRRLQIVRVDGVGKYKETCF
nr:MAG: replication associated protein [Cressdnaviricota sp.]